MTLLTVSGLSRTYGDRAVLDGLDLTLAAGRAIALTGTNGSGKSTLLRCVAGADEPTTGEVLLDGRPYDERSAQMRRDVAALLDDLDLFPDLAVIEHLDLVAHAHRVEDPEGTVDGVLDEVGLNDQADQLPGSLSSGQRQRLALALLLVRPRRLLLLDEPEQRLDAEGAIWLADLLQREKEAGVGILFASHHPALVDAVADDVVRLGSSSDEA
ncbi:heme ABC exporter ATP-binding protein CcmA [Nocardioides sp. YIM B13467]|uniref:heme ABC exporter ATP-binding protein CcmA n=1 Tax=Nocardioides sp. YIM B13467 TaxID=3366294 RepID=UPI00366DA91E